MYKLINRIKYGKSDIPKYIQSKKHWLYKNKWIDSDRAYEIVSGKNTRYTYELINGNVASFGELDSFDAVVDLVMRYPTQAVFPDLTQFSMQEVNIILGIQQNFIQSQRDQIQKNIREADAEIQKIQHRLWG